MSRRTYGGGDGGSEVVVKGCQGLKSTFAQGFAKADPQTINNSGSSTRKPAILQNNVRLKTSNSIRHSTRHRCRSDLHSALRWTPLDSLFPPSSPAAYPQCPCKRRETCVYWVLVLLSAISSIGSRLVLNNLSSPSLAFAAVRPDSPSRELSSMSSSRR
jgi:hypothetical protein